MPSPNKQKGNRWEREVADHLSAIFGLSFQRIPNSGAFVGGKNNFRKDTLSESQLLLSNGDIIVPDELKHISLECKSYKDFSFSSLFTTNKTLDGWIEQSKSSDRQWFLVIKITHSGSFVVFNKSMKWLLSGPYMRYKDSIICSLDGFFKNNKDIILNKLG